MSAIYRKELRSYFINPIGYIYLGVFLVFSALLCCYTTLISGSYDTGSYFTYLILKFSKNRDFLNTFYEQILDTYKKNYLNDWDIKPIARIDFALGKKKRIVFEIRREKERA